MKSIEELLAEAGDAYQEYYQAIQQMQLKED
jgi:cellobiose-specific phosphotransferase system component IIA